MPPQQASGRWAADLYDEWAEGNKGKLLRRFFKELHDNVIKPQKEA